MADRGDTHYFGPTLHKWFFFSSGLLLLSVVWMVIDDWNAPWKNFQREFRDIDAQLARSRATSRRARRNSRLALIAQRRDVVAGGDGDGESDDSDSGRLCTAQVYCAAVASTILFLQLLMQTSNGRGTRDTHGE